MPIKEAGKKALRQSKKRNKINVSVKSKIHESIKNFNSFIKDNKIEEAKKLLQTCYTLLDKAAKKNVIKKNTASRKKSRLTQALNKVGVKTKKKVEKK
jgi:small subunit ribosomal protein S20